MVVHPSFGHYSGTLVNALLYHSDKLSNINGPLRPGIVHRIDMNTTGSLIICKNNLSHENIAKQLKNHSINRVYIGIVHGNIKEDKGTIDANIGRSKIDRKKILSNVRTNDVVNARRIATYLVNKNFNYTLQEIGKVVGNQSHSNVIVSLNWIEKNANSNPTLKLALQKIESNLKKIS